MARNDTENFETEFGNRAHLRASADGWHAVASAAVAATLLVAVVGRHAVAGRRAALAPAVSDGAAIPVQRNRNDGTRPPIARDGSRISAHSMNLCCAAQTKTLLFDIVNVQKWPAACRPARSGSPCCKVASIARSAAAGHFLFRRFSSNGRAPPS